MVRESVITFKVGLRTRAVANARFNNSWLKSIFDQIHLSRGADHRQHPVMLVSECDASKTMCNLKFRYLKQSEFFSHLQHISEHTTLWRL